MNSFEPFAYEKVLIAQDNQLEELNLEKSKSLKKMVASNNKLANLSLNSAALAELFISNNKLDTLDITSARKLEVIIASEPNALETMSDITSPS